MKILKKITTLALAAALLGSYATLSTPAHADSSQSSDWSTQKKDKRPKPEPTPKPGPREGGADD